MTPFPDTSAGGTRLALGRPIYGQPKKAPWRMFFTFMGHARRINAPKGYAFNGRGDLVSLKRRAKKVAS